jgi:hypothetical protein
MARKNKKRKSGQVPSVPDTRADEAESLFESGALEEAPGAPDASAGPGTGYRDAVDTDLDEHHGRPGVPPETVDGDVSNSNTRSDGTMATDDLIADIGDDAGREDRAGYGTVVSAGGAEQRSIRLVTGASRGGTTGDHGGDKAEPTEAPPEYGSYSSGAGSGGGYSASSIRADAGQSGTPARLPDESARRAQQPAEKQRKQQRSATRSSESSGGSRGG